MFMLTHAAVFYQTVCKSCLDEVGLCKCWCTDHAAGILSNNLRCYRKTVSLMRLWIEECIGQEEGRTTVQEMVDSLKGWWKKYVGSTSKEDVKLTVTALEECLGWERTQYGTQWAFTPKVM